MKIQKKSIKIEKRKKKLFGVRSPWNPLNKLLCASEEVFYRAKWFMEATFILSTFPGFKENLFYPCGVPVFMAMIPNSSQKFLLKM